MNGIVRYKNWIDLGNNESITINRKTIYYSKKVGDFDSPYLRIGVTITKNGNIKPYLYIMIELKPYIVEIYKNGKVKII